MFIYDPQRPWLKPYLGISDDPSLTWISFRIMENVTMAVITSGHKFELEPVLYLSRRLVYLTRKKK